MFQYVSGAMPINDISSPYEVLRRSWCLMSNLVHPSASNPQGRKSQQWHAFHLRSWNRQWLNLPGRTTSLQRSSQNPNYRHFQLEFSGGVPSSTDVLLEMSY